MLLSSLSQCVVAATVESRGGNDRSGGPVLNLILTDCPCRGAVFLRQSLCPRRWLASSGNYQSSGNDDSLLSNLLSPPTVSSSLACLVRNYQSSGNDEPLLATFQILVQYPSYPVVMIKLVVVDRLTNFAFKRRRDERINHSNKDYMKSVSLGT